MRVNRYDTRFTAHAPSYTKGAGGGPVTTWTESAPMWGGLSYASSDRDLWGRYEFPVECTLSCERSANIAAGYRVEIGTDVYDVMGVDKTGGDQLTLHLAKVVR